MSKKQTNRSGRAVWFRRDYGVGQFGEGHATAPDEQTEQVLRAAHEAGAEIVGEFVVSARPDSSSASEVAWRELLLFIRARSASVVIARADVLGLSEDERARRRDQLVELKVRWIDQGGASSAARRAA